jgi:glycine oxidase
VPDRTDVVVIGGGVIGFAIAWRVAQRGLAVSVVDPAPGSGASHAAAGMLAPVTETHYAEEALLRLNLAAAQCYPAFVGELEDVTGTTVGYRRTGTVLAAWDAADLRGLRDLYEFQVSLGLDVEFVGGATLHDLEPELAPGLPGGLVAPGDHQVEPAQLIHSLRMAAEAHGAHVIQTRALQVAVSSAGSLRTRLADGSELTTDRAVVASGAWTSELKLPNGVAAPVRPVKGQTLHLYGAPDLLTHVVRGSVRGRQIYLVSRTDGRIVLGASVEEAGFDLNPRVGVMHDLLRDAHVLVPQVSELSFAEVRTGLRPGTPDNAPILGETSVAGLFLATGHFRNGVLLAPITADIVSALLVGEQPDRDLRAFRPDRFSSRAHAVEVGSCG